MYRTVLPLAAEQLFLDDNILIPEGTAAHPPVQRRQRVGTALEGVDDRPVAICVREGG
jgi:hypothetical protein